MKTYNTTHSRIVGLCAALAAFGSLSALATAQPAPPPPPAFMPGPPPPACGVPASPPAAPASGAPGRPAPLAPGRTARLARPSPLGGMIVATRPYHVQIRTGDGRYVNLALRNGTVINPLGTTLTPGMCVAVRGVPGPNNAVATDEVDVGPPPMPNSGPAGPAGAVPPPPGPGRAPGMPPAPPAGPPPPPARR